MIETPPLTYFATTYMAAFAGMTCPATASWTLRGDALASGQVTGEVVGTCTEVLVAAMVIRSSCSITCIDCSEVATNCTVCETTRTLVQSA